MRSLTIFYDAECGLCARFRRWMEKEPAHLAIVFLPYNSDRALELCPSLPERGADREIVVMADDGRLWQGAEAWVTCLWALRRWRGWSKRLASPVLLPLARRMCHLVSANRLTLSGMAGLEGDAVVAQEIHDAERQRTAGDAMEKGGRTRRERGQP